MAAFTKVQQIILDNRLPLADYDRVFPHDQKYQAGKCFETAGLLWMESFIEGLSPLSFFVHATFGHIGCYFFFTPCVYVTKLPSQAERRWWSVPPAQLRPLCPV
jgi:hypothetical protein